MATNRTVYHVVPDASGERWLVTQENGGFRQEQPISGTAMSITLDATFEGAGQR
jgi:hypothetical protein